MSWRDIAMSIGALGGLWFLAARLEMYAYAWRIRRATRAMQAPDASPGGVVVTGHHQVTTHCLVCLDCGKKLPFHQYEGPRFVTPSSPCKIEKPNRPIDSH